ncbi:MAG: hypothetical protein BGO68_02610 [Candidatus Amoebophilus sp. 36-38]|nr:MAG: hypothetical protein BGO68_02610 [Candidatus Amoebophilus sp. 36-38]
MERDILPYLKRKSRKVPTCFISYAWGDRYHEYWVKRFSEMLNKAGIQVLLDRWVIKKGNILNEFVRKIEETDWVIVVGTKLYLEKYNKRATGSKEKEHVARLEGQLIEHLVRYSTERSNKVIPILLEGTLEESLPFMLRHKISSEFTKNDYFEELLKLIHDLYNLDNRDRHFEKIIEKFRRYAIAAGEHITEAERKAYEEKKKDGILALDKGIKEEIDSYKEEAFKLAEELAERGDYIEKELNLPTGSNFFKLHSYIPQAKSNGYVPRVKEQQELRQKLKRRGVCVVSGYGGVGKSTLVVEYGHGCKKERAVRWIQGETLEKLLKSYQDLAQELGIDYQTLANLTKGSIRYFEELTRRIYDALEDRQQPVLLILDNVRDTTIIGTCLLHRPSLIEVIITTRDKKSFKDYSQVELSSFTREEGITYIQQRLDALKPSEQDIEALIKEVGLIPQKLALATGYITEISFMNIDIYINKLRGLKKQGKRRQGKFMLPEVNLGLEILDGPSQLMMRYGAYLDADFIPLSLITSLLGIGEEEKLATILSPLEKLSLITVINGPNKQGIRIHREIQIACREYQDWVERAAKVTKQDLVKALIQVLVQYMPEVTRGRDSTWDQARLYASNVSCVLATATKEEIIQPLLAVLLSHMGSYSDKVTCNYEKALIYHGQALKMRRDLYKGNHSDIAGSLYNLGDVYRILGQYQEALKYYQQAFEMSQALYIGNHPCISNILNNIGVIYRILGKYEEALKYYQQTLEMRKALYKGNHLEIAGSLNNIGIIYKEIGKYEEALKYYQEAFEISQGLSIGNHPYVGNILSNLGVIYEELGKYEEALKHHERALEMRKALYKGNHLEIAISLNNIGVVYKDLRKYKEALKYCQQAFEMRQDLYKGDHIDIVGSVNNIGVIYKEIGKYEEALKYHQQAFEMSQVLYISNHPYIGSILNNIGVIYREIGKYEEALKHHEQALEMRKGLYKGNHMEIVGSLNNIGMIYKEIGKYEEALKYYQQAFEMGRALSIGNHPYIGSILNNVGMIYKEIGKYEEALKHHEQALEMRKVLYKGNHPDIATSLNGLGMVYKGLGNLQQALECYTDALKMFEALYPDRPEHLDIQKIKGNMEKLEEELRKAKQDHE